MSIKYKIPGMMLAVFAVNVVILWIFFQFYGIPYFANAIAGYQAEADALILDVAEAVDGGTLASGVAYLEQIAGQDPQISFAVEDIETREQTHIPMQQKRNLGFAAVQPVTLSGKMYILSSWRDFGILHSIDGTLYRITLLELLVFSLSFLLCGAVMHARYVRPILRLKEETDGFLRRGTKLLPTKRTDELGALENSFYHMTEELAEEKRKQNRIIASISHDIKTPLTSLMGFSERLLKKNLAKEKQEAYLQNIYAQAQHIESIVEDFDEYLSFALEGNLQPQPTDIALMCDALAEQYAEPLAEEGVSFAVHNACAPSTTLQLDAAKMRRVFGNLLGNAVRHNDKVGLAITVTAREYGNLILFDIEDNGKGVASEDLEHLFEPFYTSDKSRKVAGLGLSICQEIVQSHGGTIRAENTGNGFAVRISIPKS